MYVKVFSSMLDSSIWAQPDAVVRVWLTVLLMSDPKGFVRGSDSGVIRRANLQDPDEGPGAIKILVEPDIESQNQDYGGRRIERAEGGFQILNYHYYRTIKDEDMRREQTAARVRDHRDRKKAAAPAAPTPAAAPGKAMVRGDTYKGVVSTLPDVLAKAQQRADKEVLRAAYGRLWFAYWAGTLLHKTARIDPKRLGIIMARLKENDDDINELCYVVDGTRKDKHRMGQNERNRKFDDVDSILKDRGTVERLSVQGGYEPGKIHAIVAKYVGGAT